MHLINAASALVCFLLKVTFNCDKNVLESNLMSRLNDCIFLLKTAQFVECSDLKLISLHLQFGNWKVGGSKPKCNVESRSEFELPTRAFNC